MAVNTILTNQYANAEDALDELNRDNIIEEVNANYGNKAAAGTATTDIDYTTGGYVVTLTMDSSWMKITNVSTAKE